MVEASENRFEFDLTAAIHVDPDVIASRGHGSDAIDSDAGHSRCYRQLRGTSATVAVANGRHSPDNVLRLLTQLSQRKARVVLSLCVANCRKQSARGALKASSPKHLPYTMTHPPRSAWPRPLHRHPCHQPPPDACSRSLAPIFHNQSPHSICRRVCNIPQ